MHYLIMESTIRSWKSKYVQLSHGNFDILVILELSYYNFNFLDTLVIGEYFNGLCDSLLTYGRRGESEWAAKGQVRMGSMCQTNLLSIHESCMIFL